MPSKRKGKGKSKARRKGGRRQASVPITGGFKRGHSALAGQEDAEFTTHRYEYSAGVTATAGAVSYIQIKGNSIYRPYVGNTDSVGGYARMYTQYASSLVISSKIEMTIAGDASTGTKGGWRVAIVPCNPSAYSVYSAFSNAAQLRDVPHSAEAIWTAGSRPARCSSTGATQAILYGDTEKADAVMSSTSVYSGTTGADPSAAWYYVVAIQPLAPITDLCSLNFAISYKVKWYKPIATAVQVSINRWGNEEIADSKSEEKKTVAVATSDSKTTGTSVSAVPCQGFYSGRLTAEEAFEDWGDVDSEYAIFKAAAQKARRQKPVEEKKGGKLP